MRARKLRTEVRREQLIQAALEVVGEEGLARLSVAAVARRVGLVPSALYRHFRGKQQLLDAIPELIKARLIANVEAVCAESPDAVERLRRLLVRHVELFRSSMGVPRMVFSEESDPARRVKVYEVIKTYLSRVARIVREGQKKGQIRRELDPTTTAVMFLGVVQPPVILWHMSDGRFDVRRHVQRSWRVFESMLVGGSPAEEREKT